VAAAAPGTEIMAARANRLLHTTRTMLMCDGDLDGEMDTVHVSLGGTSARTSKHREYAGLKQEKQPEPSAHANSKAERGSLKKMFCEKIRYLVRRTCTVRCPSTSMTRCARAAQTNKKHEV
jgi:hypothetical protein